MRVPLLLLPLLASVPALARETHVVVVRNHSDAAVVRLQVDDVTRPSGGNRLRGRVPPGAQASITYSQGCAAEVRIGFDNGREETRRVDACRGPVVDLDGHQGSGHQRQATPERPVRSEATRRVPTRSATVREASDRSLPAPAGNSRAAAPPAVAPRPEPEPWHGRSITKKLGLGGYY